MLMVRTGKHAIRQSAFRNPQSEINAMAIATESITELYRRRTPKSAALAERACKLLPSGIVHDGRRLDPYPVYIDHAAGSRKWDVDGHEYVDYTGGHGALLLGHNPPAIVAAVREQLAKGTHFG